MIGRTGVTADQVALDQMRDRAVVLAVRVDQAAQLGCSLEQEKEVVVADLLVVVSHVDLERRKARSDEATHLRQHRSVHIGDDHVEAVVDDGIRCDLPEPPVPGGGQRLALPLKAEVENRRHATESPRHRPGVEVVRRRYTQPTYGVGQVGMRIDAARHDPVAARVDRPPLRGKPNANLDDAAVPDQDVRLLHRVGRNDLPAANQQLAQGPSRPSTKPRAPVSEPVGKASRPSSVTKRNESFMRCARPRTRAVCAPRRHGCARASPRHRSPRATE